MPSSTELRARIASLVARAALRRVDALGAGARTFGRPFVSNQGRIEIGRGVVLSALPVPSHLATGAGGLLRVGDRVSIAHGASIFAHREIDIGDDVSIGPLAMLLDVDFHEVRARESIGEARPIRIGRGVRIGSGVVVLRGAIIGDGARIAANSVVSRYVPPGALAAGVPARPVVVAA